MGGVSVDGGGGGGKKAVDSEIPLIPFIDLLLCCVMFLLLTAVWQQTARIDTNQKMPGQPTEDTPVEEEEKLKLMLQVKADKSYTFTTSAGDRDNVDKLSEEKYDTVKLLEKLKNYKTLFGQDHKEIIVAPEDGVMHADFIQALDIAVGAGFPSVSVSDGAAM